MARIKYPKDFVRRADLFKDIKKKHDTDGGSSVLIPFLTQNSIDLATDNTNTDKAIEQDNLFGKADREGEEYTQARNNLFNPVMKNVKDELQFLKKLYVGNPKELGHWGATVDEERIVYPKHFLQRTQLLKDIKKRHDTLGATSPLNPFLVQNDIDMAADLADTIEAEKKHDKKEQAKRDAEMYSEKRDNLFDPVMENMRGIGQYLKGFFVNNPKELGHWGYTVDDSPRKPKQRTATIQANDQRTIKAIKLGSRVENTGEVELKLHKGKKSGIGAMDLPPQSSYEIVRGWGTITVVNTSPSKAGKISYLTTHLGE